MAKIKKIVVDAENIEPNVEAATDAKSEVAEKKRGAVKSTGVKKEPMKASATSPKTVREKKPKKERTHPPVSNMVTTFFELNKSRKGYSVAAIRNFIKNQFDCTVNKQMNYFFRKFLTAEFDAGRIKMVNSDLGVIKFNKKLALAK